MAENPKEDPLGNCCPICYNRCTDPFRLECGHTFCALCITEWCIFNDNLAKETTCPICRKTLTKKPYTTVFQRMVDGVSGKCRSYATSNIEISLEGSSEQTEPLFSYRRLPATSTNDTNEMLPQDNPIESLTARNESSSSLTYKIGENFLAFLKRLDERNETNETNERVLRINERIERNERDEGDEKEERKEREKRK